MSFEVEEIGPRIAARVKADRQALLKGTFRSELRALLEDRGVLVFKGLHFDDGELEIFSATLGELAPFGRNNIFKFAFGEKGEKAEDDPTEYTRGTFVWHVDRTTDKIPNLASVLTARRLSPTGGETEFANTYAAWDDLPADEKARLGGLRVVHSLETSMLRVQPDATEYLRSRWRAYGSKSHPLVWTHRSGRKSLLIGATAGSVEGLDEAAGRALLDRLLAWATQPRYVYSHRWRLGDVVVWDNTGTMHRANAYPEDSGRLMHRVTIKGEEAIA